MSEQQPKCRFCGLEDGACICAHLRSSPGADSAPPRHDHRVLFMCQSCEEHEPDCAVCCREDIAVMPDGTWLCDNCYSDCEKSAYGLIASDVDDFEFPHFEDLPRPAPYVEAQPVDAAQASTGHIENAAAGVIDWKMEVERLNRLLAVEPSRIKAAIRTGFAKHGLKAAWELVDEIADRISTVTPSPVAGEWQPIETAPRDIPIVVWDDPVMGEAYYDTSEKSWWWANTGPGDYTEEAIYPTLWRPMPTPPVSSTHSDIQPHTYSPDYQAMGDCRVCGHGRDEHEPWRSMPPAHRNTETD